MSEKMGGFGCFGWSMIWLGVIMLFFRFWDFDWAWVQTIVGSIFFVVSIRNEHNRGLIFPAIILLSTGTAMLFWEYSLIKFDLWRLWPVFFGSTGLALIVMWAIKNSGKWVIVPGIFLLIICGAGFGVSNWWEYQRWLKKIIDNWHILALIFSIVLIVSYWRSRSVSNRNFHENTSYEG